MGSVVGGGRGLLVRRGLPVRGLRQMCGDLRERVRKAEARVRELEVEVAEQRRRIAELQGQREALKGTVRRQAKELYASSKSEQQPVVVAGGTRQRGQQPGSPGHGRRRYDELPSVVVREEASAEERRCPKCGGLAVADGIETSEEITWRVSVVKVVHRRQRYVHTCTCSERPRHVVAAAPARLWPRALLSPALVAKILVDKYLLMQPLHRIVAGLAMQGVHLSEGSLIGMFEQLEPLLAPLFEAFAERNAQSPHLHVDETRWKALWAVRGPKHWLWCFVGPETTLYALADSRGHQVVVTFLGLPPGSPGAEAVTLICDFMAAYDKLGDRVERARCWAHLRRLILDCVLRSPDDEALRLWVEAWVARTDSLFHEWMKRHLAAADSQVWQEADQALRACAGEMAAARELELQRSGVPQHAQRVLNLIGAHWDELTRCVEDPEIRPDNNAAERALRNPVCGRKAFGGSGSYRAGQFLTTVLSILTTVAQNGLNPLSFLIAYLMACAESRGRPPEDLRRFCPWTMTEDERQTLTRPPQPEPG